ncbi:MAG: tRNA (adenosine(37)-N6)-threonylcarbamoyltransferase complex dimerization subunit type 1 TsaB [Eubacteriales bacterium]|nr:tRNA (adenosine(37)-N6)-threonylcarbamoyltransferase complex dimerization subunit type 1 TsaB [Eubacteriales bacterium]
MICLAFDTTAKAVTAALCDGRKLLSAYFAELPGVHTTETLLPSITHMLTDAGLTFDDIGLVAVTVGPGSFTGVRIGAATAKGLVFGRSTPCAAVSSLRALASNLLDREGILLAAMDARRDQLYYAFFSVSDGVLTRLTEDAADSAEAVARQARALGAERILCTGDGAAIAASALTCAGIRAILPAAPLDRQFAYGVALCGLEDFESGKTVSGEELLPTYLRGFGNPPQEKADAKKKPKENQEK